MLVFNNLYLLKDKHVADGCIIAGVVSAAFMRKTRLTTGNQVGSKY